MNILNELITRYPILEECKEDIQNSFTLLVDCYKQEGTLYLCGNGGSASDSEHIVGELMKSFTAQRPLSEEIMKSLDDDYLSSHLEGGLRAVSLTGHPSLATAFANDVAPDLIFAQQVLGYGRKGDILLGLSTSGNSKNILHALKVAKAKGMISLGMTGQSGGDMLSLCNTCIRVPETETYKIQELHLPIYHTLCRMLEQELF